VNRGDGTFEDGTAAWGLGGKQNNPTSAAFADLDGDSDLDLYVCHYSPWDPANPVLCRNEERGEYFYCDPSRLAPEPDRLFRNENGRFVDVTSEAGIVDPNGRGLGVVATDVDGDSDLDLFVANDGTANYLFRNLGGMRFEDEALVSGVAGNADGGFQAGMGVASGDVDGDGRPELLVTNFYGEATTLYQNLGGGMFHDQASVAGLRAATRYLLGFGLVLLDYDNDRALDLMAANGHVNDNRPYYPYGMPAILMAGNGAGRFADVSRAAGSPWDVLRVGRGLAAGDLDNDGRVDALLLGQNEPLAYFHNATEGGHFLTLRLEGTTGHRDAVGALARVTVGGKTQVLERTGGGSYQSASDGRLHFGLGSARTVDRLEITWPGGATTSFENVAGDHGYLVREGAKTIEALKGFGGAGR
jgi:hypothetical protein